jgi:hypothetical protein
MKFDDLINKKMMVLEAEPAPQDAAMPPQNQQPEAQPDVPAPATEQPAAALSPEGEVMLVRLLVKAFVINPDAEDAEIVSNLADVNEKNAKTVLATITKMIRKYSDDDANVPA